MQLDAGDVVNAVVAFGGPPLWAAIFALLFRRNKFFSSWIWGCAAETIPNVLDRQHLAVIAAAASAVLAAFLRWRRKRKRSAKLIGAKSRALLAAVVARMRETLRPRPVLRPGGARA